MMKTRLFLAFVFALVSGAAGAQTYPGKLPAFNVYGNPTGSEAPPTAFPILSTPNAWTASQTFTPPSTISGFTPSLLALTTNPTTISGGTSELDHFRCSQANGGYNQYLMSGTTPTVSCFEFQLQANAGSVAASNLYGIIGAVNNLGAGTVAGLYGRGSAGSSSATGSVFAIKSGVNCGTALANCYLQQANVDTTTFGGVMKAFFWGASLQGTQGSGLAHYGILLDNTVSYDQAQFAGYGVGSANFLQLLDATGANTRYVVTSSGNTIQCGGTSGGVTANCVNTQVIGTFTNWSWNWPTTPGLVGSVLLSQAGGSSNMVWLDDVAAGQVLVSGGAGANPAYSANPTVATFRTTPILVASLPACAAGNQGARAFVTDQATAVAYHGAVTGSGGNKQGVTCDGSAWYQD